MNDLPGINDAPLPWQRGAWDGLVARLTGGQPPHGLLITGQSGVGKGLFAAAFARYALCKSPAGGRACGRCASCQQFAAGTHPDYSHVTFEEREGKAGEEGGLKSAISVAQIRELIAALQLSSHSVGGRKLAVIEPAEGMSAAAANSLLKTLEEPPADTILILVSAEPGRIPATVRSRCQRLSLSIPPIQLAMTWLEARASRGDWRLLLGLSGGAPLQALGLASTGLATRREAFFASLAALRLGRENPVKLAVRPKDEYPELLNLLWSFTSDLILLKSAGAAAPLVNRDQLPLLQKAAEGIHLRSLHAYLDRVQAAIEALDTPANRELAFAVLLSDWAGGLDDINNSPLASQAAWG
ncbi:MAG: DNA polymerase III subunit delta' [Bacillota bacterium]